MILLVHGDALGGWPKRIPFHSVPPRGFVLVTFLFPTAVCTGVIGANGVEAVGVAICSHVTFLSTLGASAITVTAACVWVDVLVATHFLLPFG